jgi:hypothetical protein
MPPDKRTGPEVTTPQARPSDTSTMSAPTVASARCKFLHPRHLTGCRQLAEPGSVYCERHGGAV